MIPRVDDVERVELGRWYLVPTVWYPLHGRLRDWPVIGPEHEDAALIGYPYQHFHFDARFLSEADVRWLSGNGCPRHPTVGRLFYERLPLDEVVARQPLPQTELGHGPPLPAPVLRRRLCKRQVPYAGNAIVRARGTALVAFPKLAEAFAGVTCKRERGALICPHRGARLTMPADADGIITCPLHGLRIDAKSGRVLEPPT